MVKKYPWENLVVYTRWQQLQFLWVSFFVIFIGLWKVWTQESFQKSVEFDRPSERSPE